MKKIEDFKNSRCKYEGMKVYEEGFTEGTYCTVICAANEILIAKDKYDCERLWAIRNRSWYFYEEPKTKEVATFVYKNDHGVLYISSYLKTKEKAQSHCDANNVELVQWPYGDIITVED